MSSISVGAVGLEERATHDSYRERSGYDEAEVRGSNGIRYLRRLTTSDEPAERVVVQVAAEEV
jgi:hypothetical protein